MTKKQIVVGLPIEIDSDIDYNKLNNRQIHELALSDENAVIYDTPNDFFNELNEDLVDIENMFWFLITIN